jgi:hypothetical protein
MEYNNVGASQTGHRDVFTTSDEIHLTAHLMDESEWMDCRNVLVAEDVSAHRCCRLTTRVPPAHPAVDIGDKPLAGGQIRLRLSTWIRNPNSRPRSRYHPRLCLGYAPRGQRQTWWFLCSLIRDLTYCLPKRICLPGSGEWNRSES